MIYVDPLFKTPGNTRQWPFKQACHMATDHGNLEELHQFAEKLGLKRQWFQIGTAVPHYDLTKNKREQAIRLGAVSITTRQMAELIRRWREHRQQKKGNQTVKAKEFYSRVGEIADTEKQQINQSEVSRVLACAFDVLLEMEGPELIDTLNEGLKLAKRRRDRK